MKILKFIVPVILLLLCATMARAQQANIISLIPGGTNNVAATSTNSYTTDMIVKSGNVGLVLAVTGLTTAATNNVIFRFTPTDGSGNASTLSTQIQSITMAGNSTNVQRCITNMLCSGVVGYRLSIENGNAVAITNVSVKYIVKSGI